MRLKTTAGIVVSICALTAMTAPAFASEFSGAKSKGVGRQVGTGVMEVAGGKLFCGEAGHSDWSLPNGVLEHIFLILEDCEFEIGGIKFKTAGTIECEISLAIIGGRLADVSFITPCDEKIPARECELTVGTEGNKELKEVGLGNSAKGNTLAKEALAGITYKTNCKGLTSGKEGKLKSEWEFEGQKFVE